MLGKRVSSKAVIQEEGEDLIFRPVHLLTCRGTAESQNRHFTDQNDILHLYDSGYVCFGGVHEIVLGDGADYIDNDVVSKSCNVLATIKDVREAYRGCFYCNDLDRPAQTASYVNHACDVFDNAAEALRLSRRYADRSEVITVFCRLENVVEHNKKVNGKRPNKGPPDARDPSHPS